MKALPRWKGNGGDVASHAPGVPASMKVPPKRKGNPSPGCPEDRTRPCLNESPSKKEGKSKSRISCADRNDASMKALPKRKGNEGLERAYDLVLVGLNESPSKKEGKSGYRHFGYAQRAPQ